VDIDAETLTEAQAQNLKRFDQKLPKDAQEIQILKGPNGRRTFRVDVPARNIPGSFARYEKTIDSAGNTVSYTKLLSLLMGALFILRLNKRSFYHDSATAGLGKFVGVHN
jgi:hypothetical protein